MTSTMITDAITNTCKIMISFVILAKRNGLLSLEEGIEQLEKDKTKETICTGTQLVINGTDEKLIERYFNNKIESADNDIDKIFYRIIREACIGILNGLHQDLIIDLMSSCIPPRFKKENLAEDLRKLTPGDVFEGGDLF